MYLYMGQVAPEGNFNLKSADDKNFVQKTTVALNNKICKQSTTLDLRTDRAFQPTVELIPFPFRLITHLP